MGITCAKHLLGVLIWVCEDCHLDLDAENSRLRASLAEVERERDEWKRLEREAWHDCKYMTDWRNRHMEECCGRYDERLQAPQETARAVAEQWVCQKINHEVCSCVWLTEDRWELRYGHRDMADNLAGVIQAVVQEVERERDAAHEVIIEHAAALVKAESHIQALRAALESVRPKIKAFLPISPIPAEQDILAIIDAALDAAREAP